MDTFDLLASKRESIASYREYLESIKRYWEVRVLLEQAVGGRLPELPDTAMPADAESPTRAIDHNTTDDGMPGMHRHGDH